MECEAAHAYSHSSRISKQEELATAADSSRRLGLAGITELETCLAFPVICAIHASQRYAPALLSCQRCPCKTLEQECCWSLGHVLQMHAPVQLPQAVLW